MDRFLAWGYSHVEWLGFLSLVLFYLLVFRIDLPSHFETAPKASRLASFGVGLRAGPLLLAFLVLGFGAFIVLPTVAPFKVIYEYTLSPAASLRSALTAIPLVLFAVSLGFALVYLVAARRGLGNLLVNGRGLFADFETKGILPSFREAMHFSLATMVSGGSADTAAAGWCRWIAIVQSLVGKVIEVVIVGAGIGLIVTRLS